MAIQMRRGEKKDFDPSKLKVGEFAIPTDTGEVYIKTSQNTTKALATLNSYGKLEQMPTYSDVGAATAAQGAKADSAIQGVKLNGTLLEPDANKTVNIDSTGAAWGNITGTITNQTDLSSALAAKADLASPTFTGTPAAPTAASGTNTTQIATTAFVMNALNNLGSPFEVGTYSGNGHANKQIDLSFAPSFVFVFANSRPFVEYDVDEDYIIIYAGISIVNGNGSSSGIYLNSSTLIVYQTQNTPSNGLFYNLNDQNYNYSYIAFK